ncbi:DcaP family trimeric outer membrane transporter [Alcanivorax limicola]|uniref:DcaP family trimeric outer membrane transporter n=1 Tax=Alcanivorax limicola TaxID=2874102 RepID=UPI001CC04951|nr:DcaP family trimeric outer membrane transporter [Alcanivorax limicola]
MKTTLPFAALAAAMTLSAAASAQTSQPPSQPQSGQSMEERLAALEARLGATTQVQFGGYIKLDGQVSRYTDGTRATALIGDDFFVPSTIPVGGDGGGVVTDFHAKESRFWLRSSTDTDYGVLGAYIEMDFLTQSMGDERITNSYAPRIRHAYATFGDVLFGQTWSVFFDVAALPDLLDFVGPVGTTLVRQAQVRYSPGQWDISLENPSSTLYDTNNLIGNPGTLDDNRYPDLVVRYRVPMQRGSLSVAAVGRELAYRDGTSRESEYGYGVTVASKWMLGDTGNDIRAQLVGGKGVGRYMGLNAFRAGEIEADGSVELIDTWSAMVAYRHLWSDQWRSSVALSVAGADNPDTVAATTPKAYRTSHVNLIYSPAPRLDLGGEVIWGQRENEDGERGEIGRVQLSAKLAF